MGKIQIFLPCQLSGAVRQDRGAFRAAFTQGGLTLRKIFSAAVAALALTASAPAAAVIIPTAYEFTVTTGTCAGCYYNAQLGTYTGQFSVNYDTVAGTYALTGMNFTLGGTLFTTANTATAMYSGTDGLVGIATTTKTLFIGGADSGAGGMSGSSSSAPVTTDFWLGMIVGANGVLTPYNYLESIEGAGWGGAFKPQVGTITPWGSFSIKTIAAVTPPPTPAVPEPATWAMMLLGFGGIGMMMRRRKPLLQIA